MASPGVMLIERFANLTGASDSEIARLLDIPRSTVQAYRVGRLPENLTEKHIERLVAAAQAYRDEVIRAVAELEMFS